MEKKADFKTMKKSEIAGFIWDYYKWYIIVGVIIIGVAVSLIHHYMSYKDPVVQIALINCNDEGTKENGQPDFSDFMQKYGYDEGKETVDLLTDYQFSLTSDDSRQIYTFQSFIVLTAAGGIDVLAADEEIYEYIAGCKAVEPLDNYLPEKYMEKYKDDIIYVTNQETGKEFAAGIRIPNNKWMVEHGFYEEDCVIGFATGTTREEAAVRMLLYLLGEEDES